LLAASALQLAVAPRADQPLIDAIEYGLRQHGVRLEDAELDRPSERPSERPQARVNG